MKIVGLYFRTRVQFVRYMWKI